MRHHRRRTCTAVCFGLFALLLALAAPSGRDALFSQTVSRGGPRALAHLRSELLPLLRIGAVHRWTPLGMDRSGLVVCATALDCASLATYSEDDVREVARALTGVPASSPTTVDTEESAYVPPAVFYDSQPDPDEIFWPEARALQQTGAALHLYGQKGTLS